MEESSAALRVRTSFEPIFPKGETGCSQPSRSEINGIWKRCLPQSRQPVPQRLERKFEKKCTPLKELKIAYKYLQLAMTEAMDKQIAYEQMSEIIFKNSQVFNRKRFNELTKHVDAKCGQLSLPESTREKNQKLSRIVEVKEHIEVINEILSLRGEQCYSTEESIDEILSESLGNVINFYLDNDANILPFAQKDLKSMYVDLYAQYPYAYCISRAQIEELAKLEIDYKDMLEINLIQRNAYLHFPKINFRIPVDFKDPEIDPYNRICLELGIQSQSGMYQKYADINKILDKENQTIIQQLEAGEYSMPREPNLLLSEYKIHIQPKRRHLFYCVYLLLKCIQTDPMMTEYLSGFKVLLDPIPSFKVNAPPRIVLYPQFGKKAAQNVLNAVFNFFKNDLHRGSGKAPRFNFPSRNGLIFYSLGDSTRKMQLQENFPQLFELMYTKNGVLFHPSLGGSPPLDLPENF